jgi:hypothetical protein
LINIPDFLSACKALDDLLQTQSTLDHLDHEHPHEVSLVANNILLKWLVPSSHSQHQAASLNRAAHPLVPDQVQISFDPNNWDRNSVSVYDSFDHHVNFVGLSPLEFDWRSFEELLALPLDLFFRQVLHLELLLIIKLILLCFSLSFCLLLMLLVEIILILILLLKLFVFIDFLVARHVLVEMVHVKFVYIFIVIIILSVCLKLSRGFLVSTLFFGAAGLLVKVKVLIRVEHRGGVLDRGWSFQERSLRFRGLLFA